MFFEKIGKLFDIDDINKNGWKWRGNLYSRIFHEHPASINETYFQHMRNSFKIGGRLVLLIPITIIHGIFPILFTTTVSRELNNIINKNKERYECVNMTEMIEINNKRFRPSKSYSASTSIKKSPSLESNLSDYINIITSYIKKE